MFKIESDFAKFQTDHLKKLAQLGQADKVLREAALDTVVIISHRVQQEGKKTDGSQIKSKAKKKYGAYSYAYGKKRNREGLQTSIIDETYTGDTMGDLIPVPNGETSYIVGFRGKKASDIAEFNEQRFGKIFHLSKGELNFIKDKITKKVNEILS